MILKYARMMQRRDYTGSAYSDSMDRHLYNSNAERDARIETEGLCTDAIQQVMKHQSRAEDKVPTFNL